MQNQTKTHIPHSLQQRLIALADRTGVDPQDILTDALASKLADLEALNPQKKGRRQKSVISGQ